MDANQVEVFLATLGCADIRRRAGWVNATCPFGRFFHSYGKDRIPSFGISIDPNGESRCRCQACGVSGQLIAMLWRLEGLGVYRQDLLPYLLKHNQFDVTKFEDEPPKATTPKAMVSRLDKASSWGPGKVANIQRVGINFGPVVGGVVGQSKYAFDIWGDAVNTASRVEGHTPANSVAMSGAAWTQISHLARGESLGLVDLKGKGSLEIVVFRSFRE